MKPSLYNTVLKIDDRSTLVYNALSDGFVAIRRLLERLPQTEEEIKVLEDEDPLLFRQLTDIGALVEDSVDEVEIVRRRIEETDNDDSFFIMHVNPTLDCNFNCWYCYETHQKGSMISDEVVGMIVANARRIITESPNLREFTLSFFGGEPLLGFPKVKEMIEQVARLCEDRGIRFVTGFTTNAFLLTDAMIDFLRKYPCTFQITLDGGQENHNKTRFGKGGTPSYDVILGNVVKLVEAGFEVVLRVNYTSQNVRSTEEIIDWLETHIAKEFRNNIRIDYQRVWQDKSERPVDDTYRYVAGLRHRIRALGIRATNNRILNAVTGSCYGDRRNHVLVNYDGKLFGCTAREFSEDNSVGKIKSDGFYFDVNKTDLWHKAKFSKKVCETCRMAPLCGGGCRQQAVDHYDETECMYHYTSEDIDDFIMERFEELYMPPKGK